MRPVLLLLLLLSACARPPVRVKTLSEGRDYLARPVPLYPPKCQQRVALPKHLTRTP